MATVTKIEEVEEVSRLEAAKAELEEARCQLEALRVRQLDTGTVKGQAFVTAGAAVELAEIAVEGARAAEEREAEAAHLTACQSLAARIRAASDAEAFVRLEEQAGPILAELVRMLGPDRNRRNGKWLAQIRNELNIPETKPGWTPFGEDEPTPPAAPAEILVGDGKDGEPDGVALPGLAPIRPAGRATPPVPAERDGRIGWLGPNIAKAEHRILLDDREIGRISLQMIINGLLRRAYLAAGESPAGVVGPADDLLVRDPRAWAMRHV